MNAVGIDVSKGRSTVAILRPMGEVVMAPEDISHEASGLDGLADRVLSLEGDTKVLMEATGRYHETIASALHERGVFVSVVNPILIHHYNPGCTVRKVKTDKKDSGTSNASPEAANKHSLSAIRSGAGETAITSPQAKLPRSTTTA